jgi:LEA14-like dessication related protein
MKYLKPTLIISGLGIIGYALYRYYQKQLNFLQNIQYSVKKIKILNVTKEDISLEVTLKVYNASNVEATITEMFLDLYLNEIKVGTIDETKDILLLSNKTTDVAYKLSFNPQLILKNVVNLVSLTIALKDMTIRAEGYVKVKSGFISTTLPFSYKNNLKSILN